MVLAFTRPSLRGEAVMVRVSVLGVLELLTVALVMLGRLHEQL